MFRNLLDKICVKFNAASYINTVFQYCRAFTHEGQGHELLNKAISHVALYNTSYT